MINDLKLLEKTFGIDVNEYDDPNIWERIIELEKEEREEQAEYNKRLKKHLDKQLKKQYNA